MRVKNGFCRRAAHVGTRNTGVDRRGTTTFDVGKMIPCLHQGRFNLLDGCQMWRAVSLGGIEIVDQRLAAFGKPDTVVIDIAVKPRLPIGIQSRVADQNGRG